MVRRASFVLAIACTMHAFEARADGLPDRTLFVPVGVNLGYGMQPGTDTNGFLLGPEVSLAYFFRGAYAGLYTDAIRDFGIKEWRFSVGPELGWYFFGIDGGFVHATRDDGSDNGVVGRVFLSLVLIHAYGRVGHLWEGDRTYGEIGILLKLPIPVATHASPPPLPPPEPAPPTRPIAPDDAPTPEGPLAPDAPPASPPR